MPLNVFGSRRQFVLFQFRALSDVSVFYEILFGVEINSLFFPTNQVNEWVTDVSVCLSFYSLSPYYLITTTQF